MSGWKKYFGGVAMTWPRVLLLAVATAVYTALVLLLPFLDETSFQDIGVYLDAWFLFAVFIVVNCGKWWEAAVKCFVFFLVSQPLIYLIQVPFSNLGWGIFGYYRHWFVITLLTLPGGAIAFLVKKKNWLSVAVLSVATGFLAWSSVNYLRSAIIRFPHHLLSCIFSLALAVFFVMVLLDKKRHRIAVLAITAAVWIAAMAFVLFGMGGGSTDLYYGGGDWSCVIEDTSVVSADISEDGHIKLTAKHNGSTELSIRNEDGFEDRYLVRVIGSSIVLTPIDDD